MCFDRSTAPNSTCSDFFMANDLSPKPTEAIPKEDSTPEPVTTYQSRDPADRIVSWVQTRRRTSDSVVRRTVVVFFKIGLILSVLYIFLVSIGLMGAGFALLGKDFARVLIQTTANPFIGLFVGIFATALIQSSSTTTSMVVAFVAADTLSIQNAIPIIMGANIGTSVTSMLVSLGHISRRQEFRRAFAAGSVHDMFNLLAVAVFLPLELMTGYLETTARWLTEQLSGSSGLEFSSPLKLLTQPVVNLLADAFGGLGLSPASIGVVIVVFGITLLIGSLIVLSKLLKALVFNRLKQVFQQSFYQNGLIGMMIGITFTAIVQSSSVTTALMIPMAAAGIMTLNQIFPVALGANLGTTITALLASLATGKPAALTIALVHLLFNLSGILLFYPLPFMRGIPIGAARWLADKVTQKRYYAVLFILVVFFLIPGLAILIT
jgi:solute carrier family 34 (sodium-dependent phosphate cotransporter)